VRARVDRVFIFVACAKTTKRDFNGRCAYQALTRRLSAKEIVCDAPRFCIPRDWGEAVFWADSARRFYIGEKCLGQLYYRRRDYGAFSRRDGIYRGCPVTLIRRWPRMIARWPLGNVRARETPRWFVILVHESSSLSVRVKLLIKRNDRSTHLACESEACCVVACVLSIQRVHRGVKWYTIVSIKMTHCIYLCKYVTNDAWRNPINCLSPFVYLPMYINALVYSSESWFSPRDDG